jgi:alkanesulfonate monooxygenase SsuD/methylene tetrahydromethanopterin reductase-like flavin-dependent oxidoreductase (luciferase family)
MRPAVWTVLPLFQPSPRELISMVKATENLGLTGVVATDHLAGWKEPTGPVLEATTVLGMVSAVAECRVGSLVLQTSVRSPSYTADVVETLASVSRFPPLIGLGIGDDRSRLENARVGIELPSLPDRIDRLRETIAEIRSRTPGVEIWIGGWKPELRLLAAEMADGWNAWGGELQEFREAAEELKSLNSNLRISWGDLLPTDDGIDSLRCSVQQRVEAGAEAVVVALTPPRAATLARWGPLLFNDLFFQI